MTGAFVVQKTCESLDENFGETLTNTFVLRVFRPHFVLLLLPLSCKLLLL